jgi:two-component system, cell cycle sensor histidine kinase and response regulator CckA
MAGKAPTDQVLEAQYRQLVEQVPAITYMAERGAEGRWYYVSPQIKHILGFTPEEWMSDPQRWRKQVHPDDLGRALAEEQTLSQEGDRYRMEYRLRSREGKDVWVRDEATYVRHLETGKLVMRGLFLDITERKEAEEELRRSEQRLHATVNAAPVVLFALDPAGIFTFSAGRGLQGLGLKPGEVVGQSVFDRYRDYPEILDHVRRALSGEEFTATDKLPQLQLVYETRWAPARDSAGNPFGVIGISTDITERVQLQEQLRSMQQLEAIGRLAGGIAHDFNNLMNIVLGHAQLLSAETDLTERMKNGLGQVRRAAERAASLTHQLLAFSRKQVLQPKVLNLNEIVADVQKMLSRVIGEDIELATRLHPSLAPVKADPVQMEQVLMNLAVNARDAMPHGGTLLMETNNVELDEVDARRHPGSPAGPCVMLTVSDTGHGMDAETLEHVFEPFFTTKGPGKGTGMGLATVYGIVTQSGGNILVSSTLGKGTTFQIYLPAETALAEVRVEKPVEEVAGGTETILVVEDEPNLREIARIFLEDYGYRVLEAVDVEESLQIAKTFADPIHLLLTDVIMPGMSGRQLASQILTARPEMKVVYMSGYTDDMLVHHEVLEPGVTLLQKPFNNVQLARKIRSALDGP